MGTPTARTPDWIAETLSPLPPLLTAEETISVLRTSRRTFYKLVAAGHLRAIRQAAGGSSRLLLPKHELARYLRALTGE